MRFTAIIFTLLSTALGVAACGSSSPSGTATNASAGHGSDASSNKALEFASCMRSHGVPNFPDPKIQTGPGGGLAFGVNFSGTGIDPNSPAFQAAQKDCGSILGNPKVAG